MWISIPTKLFTHIPPTAAPPPASFLSEDEMKPHSLGPPEEKQFVSRPSAQFHLLNTVWEELESQYTDYTDSPEGRSARWSRSLFPHGLLHFFTAFSELIVSAEISLKVRQSLPNRYGWAWSSCFFLFIFLFPRARDLKGLPFLKHSTALPGVRLLFLPSILLFCRINSR